MIHPTLTIIPVVAAALAVVLAGCAPGPEASAPSGETSITLSDPVDVATGLAAPWSIAFVGEIVLVSERDSGRILELDADGDTREVATIAGISHGGEGGLLGLATAEGRLFVYSTGDDGNRVESYALTGDPGDLSLSDRRTILDGLPSAGNHNGGRLAFGPDGMLYVSVGDAGSPDRAQDSESLAGKILRMTPEGDVPSDNPFTGSLVYSLGHRNVQGLAWTSDGTMFATEFGQNTWDELNIIEPGGNYGWPEVEGMGGGGEFADPVQQWSPDAASPSGLAISGDTVFIANLRGEVLRVVDAAEPEASVDFFTGEFGRLRDVAAAPDGTLWFVTNNTDGRGDPRAGDDRIVSVRVTD